MISKYVVVIYTPMSLGNNISIKLHFCQATISKSLYDNWNEICTNQLCSYSIAVNINLIIITTVYATNSWGHMHHFEFSMYACTTHVQEHIILV